MTPLDTELFNEFKRLDKLLRDSRKTERGVSDYIDDMKAVSHYERTHVPGFDRDLDRLWYCRHIRNKLAHDNTSEENSLCDPENVTFLRDFYDRVLTGEDPLARLRRFRQQARPATPPAPPRTQPNYTRPSEPQPEGCFTCLLTTIAIALIAMAVPLVYALIRLLIQ